MRTNVVLPVWVPPPRGEACCWTSLEGVCYRNAQQAAHLYQMQPVLVSEKMEKFNDT